MSYLKRIKRSISLKSVVAMAAMLIVFVSLHNLLFMYVFTSVSATKIDWVAAIPRVIGFDALMFLLYLAGSFAILEYLFTNLHRLMGVIDSIEQGDLTVRAAIETEDEIGRIAAAINKMLEHLSSIVKRTQMVSNQMAAAAAQIAATVESQASGSAEQAASIAQTSATMEELAQTTKQIAANAASAYEATEAVLNFAEKGMGQVRQTVQSIEEIRRQSKESAERIAQLGEKTQEIGRVLALINDIADQTKILALNAAIEAARAGEAGKGFSVVANEIRKLAENVTDSTDQIKKIMEDIQSSAASLVVVTEDEVKLVESSTQLAEAADREIQNIVKKIESIADAAKQISIATQQEISASDQVATAMREIAVVAQQGASSAREIASSIDLVNRLSQELREEVSRIKVSRWWNAEESESAASSAQMVMENV
jgi:methyl-accepting chemotaxis protein